MEIVFTLEAKKDLDLWKKSGDQSVRKKIGELLVDIQRSPFEGLGKPEQLKHEWSGYWSRRINKEHRLVYQVEGSVITIHSLFGHY